jgi:hypothetical protein
MQIGLLSIGGLFLLLAPIRDRPASAVLPPLDIGAPAWFRLSVGSTFEFFSFLLYLPTGKWAEARIWRFKFRSISGCSHAFATTNRSKLGEMSSGSCRKNKPFRLLEGVHTGTTGIRGSNPRLSAMKTGAF